MKNMLNDESIKAQLYDLHRSIIHETIKTNPTTKPLWRKLFWTTGRNSIKYKAGCIDIAKEHFPKLFNEIISKRIETELN